MPGDQQSLTGSQFDGFTVEEELGRGGMGVVYLAEQVNLGRKVALKIIAPSLSDDADFRRRFEREARAAASLDHPNVVPVFEAGAVEERLYLSMRYVRGTDLSAVLATEGRLRPDTAADVVRQLASALDAAHSTGLIHRDVKPGNVLISNFATEPHVYLSDFGLTKEASEVSAGLTSSGHWVGTLDYVAPEQLDSREIDARTDVYSLGCVLFQMLAGRVPYTGTSVQKMFGHANSAPPSLQDLDPALAQRFDHVIARAMAKDPAQRYPSAGDLGRAAVAAAAGAAVTQPERSVAAGAALGAADSLVTTQLPITPEPPQERRRPRRLEPPTAPRPMPPASSGAAVAKRSRMVIPLVIVTLLALGVAAGRSVAAQSGGSDNEKIDNAGKGGGKGGGGDAPVTPRTQTPALRIPRLRPRRRRASRPSLRRPADGAPRSPPGRDGPSRWRASPTPASSTAPRSTARRA